MNFCRTLVVVILSGICSIVQAQTGLVDTIVSPETTLHQEDRDDHILHTRTQNISFKGSYGAVFSIMIPSWEQISEPRSHIGLGVYLAPKASYALGEWAALSLGTNAQVMMDDRMDLTVVLPLLAGASFGQNDRRSDDGENDLTIAGFFDIGWNASFFTPLDEVAIQRGNGIYVDAGLRISSVELRFSVLKAVRKNGEGMIFGFGIGSFF